MDIPNTALEAIAKDRVIRLSVAKQSHLMFFHLYFPHYVKYSIAEFQKDIFRLTEDQSNKLACVVAFRGSGKSTLVTFSYSLWSILGEQQKKFVLIICQTQTQARQHMANMKYELENNVLLKSDLGPFQEEVGGEWAISSLVFKDSKSRIMIASVDQSIRGVRSFEHRPDLIILDDVEDINSCKTLEGRNKTFDWFTREILPLGDLKTRIILVGNYLHDDSLMMRLKDKIETKEMRGIFYWFPLVDDDQKCLWPGKFKNQKMIDNLHQSVGNELAWQQEYLLKIVSDTERVIHPEWIHYHEGEPPSIEDKDYFCTYLGVDLAVSEKEAADYTAIVSGMVYLDDQDVYKIYIKPNPINKKMTFPGTREFIIAQYNTFDAKERPLYIVESVGYQLSMLQTLEVEHIPAEGFNPGCHDKRTKLAFISHLIKSGHVLFPKKGCETLIAQLTGFGNERHDDLVDAFVMAVTEANERYKLGSKHVPIHFKRSPMLTAGLMTKKF